MNRGQLWNLEPADADETVAAAAIATAINPAANHLNTVDLLCLSSVVSAVAAKPMRYVERLQDLAKAIALVPSDDARATETVVRPGA